jgi:A118 family predicted phage portal protein
MDIKKEIEKLYGKTILGHSPNLDKWFNWYKGFDPSFHKYKIPRSGQQDPIEVTRLSLKMGKSACENWANLILNEKTNVVIESEEDMERLKKDYQNLSYWDKNNLGVEIDFALGSGAGLFSVESKINKNTKEYLKDNKWKLHYEFVNAKHVYPLKWRYGEVIECAFASFGTYEGDIVLHVVDEDTGNYIIKRYHYVKQNNNPTSDFTLDTNLVYPDLDTGSNIPWFSYLKPNLANTEDLSSPTGVSIFAVAIDTMKAIDMIYDSYYYEFILGKKRAFVSAEMQTVDKNGNVVETFDPNDIGVYVLPTGMDGNNKIQFSDGALRSEAYSKALNDNLSIFSYQVGFGKSFFSFSETGRPIQTATGIIAQNSEMFRNVQKQEIAIDKFLTQTTRALMYISNAFCGGEYAKIPSEEEILVRFDDSIFEDKESQKESDRKDVSNGVMSKVEYRAKWNSETEEVAREHLLLNPEYVANIINNLLPAVQNGVLTVERFVELVYGEDVSNKQEIINTITAKLKEANSITQEDLIASGFGSGA